MVRAFIFSFLILIINNFDRLPKFDSKILITFLVSCTHLVLGFGQAPLSAWSPRTHAGSPGGAPGRTAFERTIDRITQGSVQIELIFRLLLKITVDWPFHAISKFL